MVHPRFTPVAFFVVLLSILMFSCASVPDISHEETSSGTADIVEQEPEFPLIYGRGTGASREEALQAALLDGVRRTAETLLGPAVSVSSVDQLDRLFSADVSDGADYFKKGSFERLGSVSRSKDQVEEGIRGRIDTLYLIKRLEAAGIGGDLFTASADIPVLEDEAPPSWLDSLASGTDASRQESSAVTSLAESAMESAGAVEKGSLDLERLDLSSGERQRLTDYITSMKFMVLAEDGEDASSVDAASVLTAFLDMRGYAVSSQENLEAVMNGQEKAYEAETEGKIGVLQWTAAKLRADIAVTVEAEVETSNAGGSYSGEALFGIRIREVSGWKDLGLVRSPRGISVSGFSTEEEAAATAIVRGLTEILPDITRISEEGVQDMLVQGISYTVEILNVDDTATINRLKDNLKGEIRSMRHSLGNGSLKLNIRYLGGVESLENTLCDAAANIPGLENISLLYQRGNSLTFDVFR